MYRPTLYNMYMSDWFIDMWQGNWVPEQETDVMVTRKYEGDFILASYLLNAKVSWPSDNVCCIEVTVCLVIN